MTLKLPLIWGALQSKQNPGEIRDSKLVFIFVEAGFLAFQRVLVVSVHYNFTRS